MLALTYIKIFHLVGLIMGLGGAVLLDLNIFTRGVLRPVSGYTVHLTETLSKCVSLGLIILWITGGALIALNMQVKPDYLMNPKLWAKILIVMALTLNGMFIHRYVLPFLKGEMGNRLFARVTSRELLLLTLVGSVSFVSWVTPFVLGKASELNFVTPMWKILACYGAALCLVWAGMFAIATSLTRLQALARKIAANTLLQSEAWENAEFAPPEKRGQTRRPVREALPTYKAA